MSEFAAQLFLSELRRKGDLLVCAATGNSPAKCYSLIADQAQKSPSIFDEMRVLQLDEWGGVSPGNTHSCRSYLRAHLLDPMHISQDRFITFNSSSEDPEQECRRIQQAIDEDGPIDLCVLGLGTNGHLGFNEPAPALQAECNKVELDAATLKHSMIEYMEKPPVFGLTVGMKDILQARKILLLITGKGKENTLNRLLGGKISTRLPASFLWLHPDVECLIDKKSCSKI